MLRNVPGVLTLLATRMLPRAGAPFPKIYPQQGILRHFLIVFSIYTQVFAHSLNIRLILFGIEAIIGKFNPTRTTLRFNFKLKTF